ncbi:MAG: class I SAM-dependent methyltransferase [Mycobacteriales bacterium]
MSNSAVQDYYAAFGEREWSRLTNPSDGAVEFAVTCALLERHLPTTGRVLDIGGGPGRYTIWLASKGYRVVLADLSPNLLAIAHDKIASAKLNEQFEAIVEADARDLSAWAGASFDAVLSLGPFYHLPDPAHREGAARELGRVLRPGGVAAVAFMPRLSLLRRTLAIPDERHRVTDAAWLERLLRHGVFENDVPGRFTQGYGAVPSEIPHFFERHGFETVSLSSAESITMSLPNLTDADGSIPSPILSLIVEASSDPAILGLAGHLVYVGMKR